MTPRRPKRLARRVQLIEAQDERLRRIAELRHEQHERMRGAERLDLDIEMRALAEEVALMEAVTNDLLAFALVGPSA